VPKPEETVHRFFEAQHEHNKVNPEPSFSPIFVHPFMLVRKLGVAGVAVKL